MKTDLIVNTAINTLMTLMGTSVIALSYFSPESVEASPVFGGIIGTLMILVGYGADYSLNSIEA